MAVIIQHSRMHRILLSKLDKEAAEGIIRLAAKAQLNDSEGLKKVFSNLYCCKAGERKHP